MQNPRESVHRRKGKMCRSYQAQKKIKSGEVKQEDEKFRRKNRGLQARHRKNTNTTTQVKQIEEAGTFTEDQIRSDQPR